MSKKTCLTCKKLLIDDSCKPHCAGCDDPMGDLKACRHHVPRDAPLPAPQTALEQFKAMLDAGEFQYVEKLGRSWSAGSKPAGWWSSTSCRRGSSASTFPTATRT